MTKNLLLVLLMVAIGLACASKKGDMSKTVNLKEKAPDIKKRVSQFEVFHVDTDLSFLNATQKKVLKKLIRASRYIDAIYFRQVYAKNPDIKAQLKKAKELDDDYVEYFKINYGPFDRLDNHKPFLGKSEKPAGANFYPDDITKKEFNNWIKKHPEDEKSFKSLFTVIKREGDKLVAVPYSKEYSKWLKPAAKLMKEAASLTENKSLAKFLNSRADAFFTDDYFQSDIDWMDITDSPIEITIGPYEVYEDSLFGYKAAFESFVTVINPKESKRLQVFQKYLKALDQNLPLPEKYKKIRDKYESPIRVGEVVYAAGDARRGVQTIAFNLPNDERVREAKGNKQVMLKGRIEAKFEKILKKIAAQVLDQDQLKYLSDEAFFLNILHHELAHSIGPGSITLEDGTKTNVNKALKEKYSTIEEAKADTLSIYDQLYLIDKGELPKDHEQKILATYLAGIFRSVRFGLHEAHGAGMMIQFNFLQEQGTINFNPATGKFRINFAKAREGFKKLAEKILLIEATGDYDKAKWLAATYGKPSKEVKNALAKLEGLPVDIRPVYAKIIRSL